MEDKSINKFWSILYSLKYIGLGLFAFALPTTEWYEVTIRIVFIALGLLTALAVVFKPEYVVLFLSIGAILLSFWVLFAGSLVLSMWPQIYARLLVFTMPFWIGWIAGHFWVIKQVNGSS